MSAPRRAVCLDALGTLVELLPPAPALRVALAERHGVVVSESEAARAMAREIAFYRAEHHVASDGERLAALRLGCAAVVRDALGLDVAAGALVPTLLEALRFVAFAEVPAVLAALRARGHALAVVSNWDVSLHDVLAGAGIAVDAVVTSAELGVAKPDPAIFARALALVGADSGWHVGDTVAEDVAGARAAGLEPVLVDRNGTAPDVGAPVVRDLGGLLDII